MATKLEKLMFRIGVKDDASGPVGKLQKALRSTSRMSKQAWGQLAGGAMTVAGAGLALEGMVSPALDLNRALADVSSLDVDAKGLKLLDATAKQYAMSYGGTAAEFVASSYAIQSGIAGLDASQLADFTRASNVLAKATKADAATMTNYAGTMYGIFKQQADAQGKSSWIEDVAGKSAYAIQIFKTPYTGMEEVIVGVVGTLQFDVFEYRLRSEYNVEIRMEGLPYEYLRWIDRYEGDVNDLILGSDGKLVEDYKGRSLLLFASQWSINWVLDKNKTLELSEFGGAGEGGAF